MKKEKKQKILVTGGAGYIGSHTCVELLACGFDIVIVDNFSNSKPTVLSRIGEISGITPPFHRVDVRDRDALRAVFDTHQFDAVIHFAGLKAVGESVANPIQYYDNNVQGSLVLIDVLQEFGVESLVFSSSATVYGDPKSVPITEDFPLGATNPYGRSKLMVEDILRDLARAKPSWHIALLRYFNPVGAHASGRIGEDPWGTPNNLLPFVSQVAVGRRERLHVYGDDYPTIDGTGVRDYIHVCDLARGHVCALNALAAQTVPALLTTNLGTGRGYSVLEIVQAFERASGRKIPYEVVGRRSGDIAACFADPSHALATLGWRAELGLTRMCEDAWRWQSTNPNGYEEST